MAKKYIFYDLETTGRGKKESPNAFGTTPKWEQIMQIAAIVTDENFQETNQNINEFCRPRTSIISQPGALLTTQNGIREALHAKQSSYELMKKINSTFDEWKKDTDEPIFIGHNIYLVFYFVGFCCRVWNSISIICWIYFWSMAWIIVRSCRDDYRSNFIVYFCKLFFKRYSK